MKHTTNASFFLLMAMGLPLIASTCRRLNIFRICIAGAGRPVMVGLALLVAPVATFAQEVNPNCTLIVPHNPLTAAGLATPYQLEATNPSDGPCHETDKNQTAFVQAAVIDLDNGQISVYNPLVIDMGTTPAVPPVVPALPTHHVVALWFGFNGDNLKLIPASGHNELQQNHCVQGHGQFAYCNAVEFFKRANQFVKDGRLIVPPIGVDTTAHHEACPTVRSFFVVDQDQSDNLTTEYLFTPDGKIAQNTATNRAALPGSVVKGNPSDNRLLDVFIDGALGCIPWKVPDLTNPGAMVPALPLNELQAKKFQAPPIAQIPLGSPFALDPPITGVENLHLVNEYRLGVNQRQVRNPEDASTKKYCRKMRAVQPKKLFQDKSSFIAFRSPDSTVADTLFTFMAQRYVGSYEILKCESLLNKPVNVALKTAENGIVIDATLLQTKHDVTEQIPLDGDDSGNQME
ncbi:MAG: hypothetical protein WCH20_04035 [Nitrospira sp.]|jgi:hypothetical protein